MVFTINSQESSHVTKPTHAPATTPINAYLEKYIQIHAIPISIPTIANIFKPSIKSFVNLCSILFY